jgi:hypothetical protein
LSWSGTYIHTYTSSMYICCIHCWSHPERGQVNTTFSVWNFVIINSFGYWNVNNETMYLKA